jgi:acyl CoA:acetate/3-ketoacid CoA transferase beta subunit
VKLVCTNLGLIELTPQGFVLREIAPGYTPEEVQEVTDADLAVASDLKELQVH